MSKQLTQKELYLSYLNNKSVKSVIDEVIDKVSNNDPLIDKIKHCISDCKYTDWGFNGEDEYAFESLDEDRLVQSIFALIQEYNK